MLTYRLRFSQDKISKLYKIFLRQKNLNQKFEASSHCCLFLRVSLLVRLCVLWLQILCYLILSHHLTFYNNSFEQGFSFVFFFFCCWGRGKRGGDRCYILILKFLKNHFSMCVGLSIMLTLSHLYQVCKKLSCMLLT